MKQSSDQGLSDLEQPQQSSSLDPAIASRFVEVCEAKDRIALRLCRSHVQTLAVLSASSLTSITDIAKAPVDPKYVSADLREALAYLNDDHHEPPKLSEGDNSSSSSSTCVSAKGSGSRAKELWRFACQEIGELQRIQAKPHHKASKKDKIKENVVDTVRR